MKHVKQHSPCLSLQEAKCGFVIILMALYWCTECIPLAVTALLPVILFPMMGIMESGEVFPAARKESVLRSNMSLSGFPYSFFISWSRFVSSTWKTPTCSLLVGCWWPSLWSTGTCTGGSPFKFCLLWGWSHLCKKLYSLHTYTYTLQLQSKVCGRPCPHTFVYFSLQLFFLWFGQRNHKPLWARSYRPKSVAHLSLTLVAEWEPISAARFQHFVESLPRRGAPVMAAH